MYRPLKKYCHAANTQYSADHIQWYPPGPLRNAAFSSSPRVVCPAQLSRGKYDEAVSRRKPFPGIGKSRPQSHTACLNVSATFLTPDRGAVVAVAVICSSARLARRAHQRQAGVIAQTGGGINHRHPGRPQAGRTNELAGSILETAQPLQGKLDEIVRLAQSSTGWPLPSTAAPRPSTAPPAINGTAPTILATARSINDGVAQST